MNARIHYTQARVPAAAAYTISHRQSVQVCHAIIRHAKALRQRIGTKPLFRTAYTYAYRTSCARIRPRKAPPSYTRTGPVDVCGGDGSRNLRCYGLSYKKIFL